MAAFALNIEVAATGSNTSTQGRNTSTQVLSTQVSPHSTTYGVALTPSTTSSGEPSQEPDPIRQEFVIGSGIAPDLVDWAIEIAPDIEIDPITHEVLGTPIADALGWKYTRFGQQAKASQTAALFKQESGEVWQAKVFGQRAGKRSGQYLAPTGIGNRAYFPAIDPATRAKLGAPSTGSFWDWVEANPTVPILITEGGKKSLAALSQGTVAIALYGCDCGNSPDLERFLWPGRAILIAFDQDANRETRARVGRGIARLAHRAIGAGCKVSIVQWSPSQGKGIDDLIVQSGPAAWEQALADAMPYKRANSLSAKPDRTIDAADLCEAIKPGTIPTHGIVAIQSGMGTGKTKLLNRLTANESAVIAPGYRESLQRGLGKRLGLDYLHETKSYRGQKIDSAGEPTTRLSLCWDSILAIDPRQYKHGNYDLVIDEADPNLMHLITGGTCSKNGKRPALIDRAEHFICNAKRVLLASATLTDREIDYIANVRCETPWILQNLHRSLHYKCQYYTGKKGIPGSAKAARAMVLNDLIKSIKAGHPIHVACDQIRSTKIVEFIATNLGLSPDEILRYDGDTSTDERQRAFAENPNAWLANNPIKLLITSPSLTSGVSIEIDHFELVFGIFEGQTSSVNDCLQAMGRVRKPVPRLIYAAAHGKGGRVPGHNALAYSGNLYKRTQMIAAAMGDQSLIESINPLSPSSIYHAQTQADHNAAMGDFGRSLAAALADEGAEISHLATPDQILAIKQAQERANRDPEAHTAALEAYEDAAHQVEAAMVWTQAIPALKEADAVATEAEAMPNRDGAEALRAKRVLTLPERRQLTKFEISEFYQLDHVDVGAILRDRNGRYRADIRRFEGLAWDGLSHGRDAGKITRLTQWQLPIPQQDLPTGHLFCEAAKALGLDDFVAWAWDRSWTNQDSAVIALSQALLADPDLTQMAIGYRPNPSQSPAAIAGMALARLGLRTESRRIGTGDRERVYQISEQSKSDLMEICQARAKIHITQGLQLRPHPLSQLLLPGVAVMPKEPLIEQNPPRDPAKNTPMRQEPPLPAGVSYRDY